MKTPLRLDESPLCEPELPVGRELDELLLDEGDELPLDEEEGELGVEELGEGIALGGEGIPGKPELEGDGGLGNGLPGGDGLPWLDGIGELGLGAPGELGRFWVCGIGCGGCVCGIRMVG